MRPCNTHNRITVIKTSDTELHTSSANGFTLIEVMIALVILLLGMMGVMGMQYYAVAGNTSSREMRIATSLSQEKIEQLKLIQYSALSNSTDTPLLQSEASIYAGQSYTRRWWVFADCVALNLTNNINPCAASISATCSQDPDGSVTVPASAIRARTCWQDKNAAYHSVTIDSLRWDDSVTP